ncbi:unnamed protein product [Clonostachys rosea f. rosea IK726]|uniref:Beta-lactamase-related domain-containing protein n=2 Tax=Bionectria ochroleuca TaxID=29856 RepID=A0A0B7JUG0_BIOOC|nr:unnamed protein product [Clonostachys rosea f. rosea IK726]
MHQHSRLLFTRAKMNLFHSDDFPIHVETLMQQNHVPGLAVAIVHGDQLASAGYGYGSLDPETPCTPDTIFDIASMSKSLTAASVVLLVNDNKSHPEVQLDTPMSSLLPEDFVMSDETHTAGVTVDDILGHRTGLSGHNNSCLGVRAKSPDTPRSITRNLRNLSIAAPLRSRYLYSNTMYTVATHLVEEKSKKSFADFLQGRIFAPLGMASTHLQPQRARDHGLGSRLSAGYLWEKEDSTYYGIEIQDCPEGQGAGSVVSSANDLILWVKALMNREGPICEDVYQGMVRLRSFRDPSGKRLRPLTSPSFYAAGIEIYYYRGHAVVWHDGNTAGFSGRFFFVPELKVGAVVLGNASGAMAVSSILMRELLDDALGVPQEARRAQEKGKKKEGKKRATKVAAGPPPRSARGRGKTELQAQVTPLAAYTGDYSNAGYHSLRAEIKDGRLFIDATDRSFGFTLEFEHREGQTKYTAYLCDFLEGGADPIAAEFSFEGGVAVRMGLDLEPALKKLIWFERRQTDRDEVVEEDA